MDIIDDWKWQFNLDLYFQTNDMAIAFAKGYPDILWYSGNHDRDLEFQDFFGRKHMFDSRTKKEEKMQ